jgi:hypothetical protein
LTSIFCPSLTPDITASEVTGPIAGRNALRLDSVPQLHQVVEELAHELGVEHESPAVYYDAITHVTQLSTPPASFPEPPSSAKSTAERGIAKVEILEPQSGTDASLITTVRGTVVPEDLPVQVFVLSGDNRWYPRPAENTNGRWQATCRIGSKEGRPGGEYKLVAVAGADPVTERVNELPRGIAVSEPVTVRRKPADAAPGENVSIQLAAVENGIAVTIVNHLPDRLRGPQLLIMDIRRLARGRDRYVETSEFHQSGRFPIFAIGHIPDIFHEEQRSVMFIDASDRQVLRIEARTTGQQPKEYRATLTNAGAWEARLQLKAGERTLERRLYFAWRPGEAPRVVGPYED